MIQAYGTRQRVEGLIHHVVPAAPIPEKLPEIIIEDTLRGAPRAERALAGDWYDRGHFSRGPEY